MLSFLKVEKKMSWVLVTQKMIKKEDHCMRDCVIFKKMVSKEKNSRILIQEINRSLRVLFKKCLICTLYEEGLFSVSLMRIVMKYMYV
jgi:hypothetical protein